MRRSPRTRTGDRACGPAHYPWMVTPISTLALPSMDSNTFAGCGTRPNVPEVMVSPTIDPRAFDHKQTRGYVPELGGYVPPKCPDCARPDKDWQREFLADFSDLRVWVSRTAARREMSGRSAGGGKGLALASQAALERMDDLNEPEGVSFDALIRSDEVSAAAAFRAHARALASRLSAEEDELAKSAEPMTPAILHARASWFYALAARVGLPLDAETSASVRALARALAMRRSKVTSSRDPSLPHIRFASPSRASTLGSSARSDSQHYY